MDAQTDIKSFLDRSGWTQERLAKEAGIHPVTISRIMTGERGAGGKTLKRLWPFIYASAPSQPPEAA